MKEQDYSECHLKYLCRFIRGLIVCGVILAGCGQAQCIDLFPHDCERAHNACSFDVLFDSGDAFVGGAFYLKSPKTILDEAFVFSGLWRPFPDEVVERSGEKTYTIYRHEFYSFQCGIEEQIHLTRHMALFCSPMVGIYSIDRRGSSHDLNGGAFILNAGVGIFPVTLLSAGGGQGVSLFQVRIGYQMIRTDSYDSDKFLISVYVPIAFDF